jgi:3',5'-cyclic AMP phosphodiesterase CpdA
MRLARDRFCPLPAGVFKIVVAHHPFLPSPIRERGAIVGRAEKAMRVFDECGVDMILAGHLHLSYAAGTHGFYRLPDHSALVVQAGTATSHRTRTERNSYNAITVAREVVTIAVRRWNGSSFESEAPQEYAREKGRWGLRSLSAAEGHR